MLIEDSCAREILLDMHWSSTGWRSPRLQPSTEDYNHALRGGYLIRGPATAPPSSDKVPSSGTEKSRA
jgi:hypothetical protein